MKKPKIKLNLAGTLFIVLGVIVIVLAILFFAVDPTRNESMTHNPESINL